MPDLGIRVVHKAQRHLLLRFEYTTLVVSKSGGDGGDSIEACRCPDVNHRGAGVSPSNGDVMMMHDEGR